MNVSDEFRAALKAGNLQQAFALAVSKALELNISTAIVETDGEDLEINGLTTKINLIEGEINNKIDANIVDSRFYQTLQQFHQQQIDRGNEALLKQLESLQKMLRLMAMMQQQFQADAEAGRLIEIAAEDEPSKSLASEMSTFLPDSQANPTTDIDADDDELLSLSDLDLEEEDEDDDELMSLADVTSQAQSSQDWGDWMEPNNLDSNSDQAPNPSSDWKEDDWEEEFEPNDPSQRSPN